MSKDLNLPTIVAGRDNADAGPRGPFVVEMGNNASNAVHNLAHEKRQHSLVRAVASLVTVTPMSARWEKYQEEDAIKLKMPIYLLVCYLSFNVELASRGLNKTVKEPMLLLSVTRSGTFFLVAENGPGLGRR